ncbi:uncharacterized protein G2W53_017912 [Senna tora]|uniref:Uncharacterized protein n=1 Tax=Senna tora TaxID=362788 RepID=A0A834TQY5_9FABA|nr:uncharacterized protein G2W53_017912 [Senna tora]
MAVMIRHYLPQGLLRLLSFPSRSDFSLQCSTWVP